MTLARLTNKQLLADIRHRLDEGHAVATAERVKAIAADTGDIELLRELTTALADAMIDPRPRKNGRPRKNVTKDGAIDLDAISPKSAPETTAAIKAMMREHGICVEIHKASRTHGKNIKAECQRHQIGVDTYYKWFPAGS